MSRTILTWVILVVLCASLSHSAPAAERSAEGKAEQKYRDLIEQLVSPNEKPVTRNGANSSVDFPAGYDVNAQKQIDAARHTLRDNVEEALPFLVNALDDKRYCMTIDWAEGDAYYNRSVGSICRDVIASHLEVYRDKIRFSGPQHWNRYNYPISTEWWQARKESSLVELQVEAIDWAIDRRTVELEKDTTGEIAMLRKLRDEIAKSRMPAKPRRLLRMVTADR